MELACELLIGNMAIGHIAQRVGIQISVILPVFFGGIMGKVPVTGGAINGVNYRPNTTLERCVVLLAHRFSWLTLVLRS